MSVEQIEALGKAGGAIVAILVLGWILHAVITENAEVIEAYTKQIEMAERQTQALEKLVKIYSGE